MDTRTTPDASTIPTQGSQPAADGLVDVEAILREVEALAGIAAREAVAATDARSSATPSASDAPGGAVSPETPVMASFTGATTPANAGIDSSSNLDVAALEREIESLLRGGAVSSPVPDSVTHGDVAQKSSTPSETSPVLPTNEGATNAPTNDVRVSALAEPSVDPMLRELEEILDDSNDAVLRHAGGSVDRALDTVFDPRALSGQEEEVNRALIEAFGTSRRTAPGFGSTPAVVTNPVPRFEGISRAVPPEMTSSAQGPSIAAPVAPVIAPRTFEEIAATSIARPTKTEYAGETPFEPAFPSVPPLPANEGTAAPVAETPAARAEDTGNKTEAPVPTQPATASTGKASAAPASPASETTPAAVVVPATPRGLPFGALLRRIGGMLSSAALLPLQLIALPMRAVPSAARGYVGIAAISMALWVPVAWWMAQRSASAPGIGRIEFPVASSEGHAAASDSSEPAGEHATDDGADTAHSAAESAAESAAGAEHH